MLFTVLQKNAYQDSINLMLLTNRINTLAGVTRSSIMMGTQANQEIYRNTGLYTEEVGAAQPSDMVIVVEAESEDVVATVLRETEAFLSDLSVKKKAGRTASVGSWESALKEMPDANLALFSIPGEYAAPEIERALDKGLHVFSFTDNIALEDEVRLKQKAHEKGLLFMGPDCGTGLISGVPIAFANAVRPGNIGVVGASGTGIQEVTSLIERLGGGVVHAIGTGGRDLKAEVRAVTMKDVLVALAHDDATDVVAVISKPPAKAVRDDVMALLQKLGKPVVAIFMGEKPACHEGNVYLAHTLEETARIAVDLAMGNEVQKNYGEAADCSCMGTLAAEKTLKGLYSGGTLAAEAAMLFAEALGLEAGHKENGCVLKSGCCEILDLGDDLYTRGKPHPMIDPEVRLEKMRAFAREENTGVILLDCVLGYGSHPDMAGALAPVIREELARAKEEGRALYFVASVCGTQGDPQSYQSAIDTLRASGALVAESNAKAVRLALALKGVRAEETDKELRAAAPVSGELPAPSEKILELLRLKPRVINVGLTSFNESIQQYGGSSLQFDWKPMAGGNLKYIRILSALNRRAEIDESNARVAERLKAAQPFLIDVVPAKSVIEPLNRKALLHAGPPIAYAEMTGPMQGSCVGAALFEGWAQDEAEARRLLESGAVEFMPCHHVNAVGPMGGITSGNMPVLVVENKLDGTIAYCTMNEGIGKVLRFGAYSEEVVNRLRWMKDVLGPVLSAALKRKEGGLNLSVVIAKAITMGDEFHQRNIAASLIFLKEMAPLIMELDWNAAQKEEVVRFLAATDQFFLNVMMATGKAMVDCARKIEEGCLVTTMTRNGRQFGIRISALGDQWFTAPVNTPKGLYFTGFSEEDANPDIGDSAITETVGVGAMAMIAAPGVTRFVGAGGFEDALRVSNEMDEITIANNSNFSIPTWDFKGAPLGIDIRKVVATGITPLINTGIAHRKAGVGQIGAGTVRAPLACFEKALEAYAKHLGIEV